MNNKDYNIGDDEFHVIGQQDQDRKDRNKKLLKILLNVLAVLLCATVMTLILQFSGVLSHPQKEVLGNNDYVFGKPYTQKLDTIVKKLKLTLYIPQANKVMLTIGSPDSTLFHEGVLAFRAADIGSKIENPQPEDMRIVGAFVCGGELYQSENEVSKPKPGFCAVIMNTETKMVDSVKIGVAENTLYLEKAINSGGYFFRHFPIVKDGKAVWNYHPNKATTTRRALCDRSGQIFVAVANATPRNFARALSELGVDNAISLPGYYKSVGGWWRDKDGNIEFFNDTTNVVKYTYENYIVWE